jgi:hypothetical protein
MLTSVASRRSADALSGVDVDEQKAPAGRLEES